MCMLYLITQSVIGTAIEKKKENVNDSIRCILLMHLSFQGGFLAKEHEQLSLWEKDISSVHSRGGGTLEISG